MTKQLTAESIICKRDDLLAANVDQETVLLSVHSNRYFGMAETAHRIWELLDKQMRVQDLVDLLISEYDVHPADCQREVIQFLHELVKHDLIFFK